MKKVSPVEVLVMIALTAFAASIAILMAGFDGWRAFLAAIILVLGLLLPRIADNDWWKTVSATVSTAIIAFILTMLLVAPKDVGGALAFMFMWPALGLIYLGMSIYSSLAKTEWAKKNTFVLAAILAVPVLYVSAMILLA